MWACLLDLAALADDDASWVTPPEAPHFVATPPRLGLSPPTIDGRPTAWPAVAAALATDPDAADVLLGGRHRSIIGGAIAGSGAALLALGAEASTQRTPGTTASTLGTTGLALGAANLVVGVVFLATATSARERAIAQYNADHRDRPG